MMSLHPHTSPAPHNILRHIADSDRGYWLPRSYQHLHGVLIWKITGNCIGVFEGSAWTFLTTERWHQRFATPLPDFLNVTDMAIVSHLMHNNRRRSIRRDSLSRGTVIFALKSALSNHRHDVVMRGTRYK